MYLLYLDDSGSANNQSETYLVLGGICIFEHQVYHFTQQLDILAQQHASDPSLVEFHASEIFGGRIFPWNAMKEKDARIKVMKQVISIFANSYETSRAFACAVHKSSFSNQDPMEMAFEDLCSRFDIFLTNMNQREGTNHRGMIILDESAHETTLQSLARRFNRSGTKYGTIRNIVEVPLFVDSKASRCIQVADHIAYSVFRRYEHGDTSYLDLCLHRFDSDGKIIHGLCHKQAGNQNCMCPACLSRK
jgi:Protein of unknown function (DUF3800)